MNLIFVIIIKNFNFLKIPTLLNASGSLVSHLLDLSHTCTLLMSYSVDVFTILKMAFLFSGSLKPDTNFAEAFQYPAELNMNPSERCTIWG